MKMLTLLSIFIFSFSAYAINGRTTYQAKIIKPDGYPLESASVNFRFTVLDVTGSCVMYVEDYAAVNMMSSGGLISFALGTGTVSFPASSTATTFSTMFDNSVTSFSCQSPGIYNPIPTDNRKIVMQFNDSNGWQTLPAMAVNAVPYAMYAAKSQDSQKLNGKADTAFLQKVSDIPTCAAGKMLYFNMASFSCIDVPAAGVSINSVSVSGSALSITGTASDPVITMSAASVSKDGYLTSLDYAEFKAKLSASSTQIINTLGYAPVSGVAVTTQINNSNLSGDVSGTISSNSVVSVGGKTAAQISTSVNDTLAATSSATADTLVKRNSSGNATFSDIYANAAKLNYVDIYKPSTSFNIRLQAPTSLSTNYVLNLPTTSGTVGQVLSTDGSGNLSWINPSTGSVVSVSATAPLASTGGSNPTISITQATSTTAGYLSSTDWNTFNNKQAATSAAIIATLGYTPANATSATQWTTNGSNIYYNTGNIGVGIINPSAKLELASGTASVAPLKFTSGTLLSSAQSGTMEYDGFNFYLTDSTNTRRTIATGSSAGTIDNASTINSSGNISMVPVGSVIVSSTTASTNSNTGALVVKGGLGVAGNINTDGNLNVSGSSVIDGSLKLSSMTSGSVLFSGASGTVTQDNSSLYWDGANKRLGLGTNLPAQTLSVSGTGYFSGNVGIGTPNPGFKFVVNGDAQIMAGLNLNLQNVAGNGNATIANSGAGTNKEISFSTGAANAMLINNAGYVGIGTTGPGDRLHISSVAQGDTALRVSGSSADNNWGGGIRLTSDNGTTVNATMLASTNGLDINNNKATPIRFFTNNTEAMRITSSGNVGIGTTTPGAQLDISNSSMSALRLSSTAAGGKIWEFDSESNGAFSVVDRSNSVRRMSVASGDYITFYKPDGSTSIMHLTGTGNVGIGTTAPTSRLHVFGDSNFEGNITQGGAGKSVTLNDVVSSFGLPAQGTRIAVFNLPIGSVCKVSLFSSENNFYQPIELDITRQNFAGSTPLVIRTGKKIHAHSDDIAFSADTNGDVWMEKVDFATGRAVTVKKVEIQKGSCAILPGTTTAAGVGADQSVRDTGYFTANSFGIHYLGNVGIGTNTPTAGLHLAAGTSSNAPLKLTSGTLLTSPQSGTMEYDGTNFYVTDGTNTRRAIAANTNPGTYDNVSNINSSGNITMTPTGSVVVSSTTASTNSSTGALVVKGGLGVAGDIYTSGTIVTSSNIQGVSVTATSGMISPYIYGSTSASGNLTLESTTNATKGNVLIASQGGNVGIGTLGPSAKLTVKGGQSTDTAPLGLLRLQNYFSGVGTGNRNAVGLEFANGDGGATNVTMAGIYVDTADTSEVNTKFYLYNGSSNVERMRITGSGNVGIGTTSPTNKLDVVGGNNSGLRIKQGNQMSIAPASSTSFYNGVVLENGGSSHAFALGYTIGGHFGLNYFDGTSAYSNLWTITNSGNVGIGTTSPSSAMHLSRGDSSLMTFGANTTYGGILSVGSTNAAPVNATTAAVIVTDGNLHLDAATGKNVFIGNYTASDTFINPVGGKVGIGTTSPSSQLHVYKNTAGPLGSALEHTSGTAAQYILGSGGSYIGYLSTQPLYIGTTTANMAAISAKMTLDVSGNVGIGTTSPAGLLNVHSASSDPISYLTRGDNGVGNAVTLRMGTNNPAFLNYNSYIQSIQGAGIDVWSLAFGTGAGAAATEKMRILPGGNVGIGTTAPTGLLANTSLNTGDAGTIAAPTGTGIHASAINWLANGNGYVAQFVNSGTTSTSNGLNLYTAASDSGSYILNARSNAISRFVVRADGNVGIGTTSPAVALDVAGVGGAISLSGSGVASPSTGLAYGIFPQSGRGLGLYSAATGAGQGIGVWTNKNGTTPTEVMTILRDGNVGIGTSAPVAVLHSKNAALVGGNPATSGIADTAILQRIEANTGVLDIGMQSSGAVWLQPRDRTNLASNFNLLLNSNGGNVGIGTTAPNNKLEVNGTILVTAGAIGTNLINGSFTNNTNRSYMDSSGYFWSSMDSAAISANLYLHRNNTTQNFITFGYGTAAVGSVTTNGSSVAYNTTSDYRLKENIHPMINSVSRILKLQPKRFNYKTTPNEEVDGFIAHEVSVVVPEAVHGKKDAVDQDGNVIPQLVDYSKVVPVIAGAVREIAEVVDVSRANKEKPAITIDENSRIGIGTTAPGYTLHVVGTAGLSTGTAWTNASDRRLKDIQGDYEYGLNEVLKLHAVRYNYKKDNALGLPSDFSKTGFIAQEVQKVIPDAVNVRKDGYLELNVDPIHWAVVNAVKDLYKLVVEIKNEILGEVRGLASIVESKADKAEIEVLTEKAAKLEAKAAEVDVLKAENAAKSQEIEALKAYLCSKDSAAPICK